MNMSGQRPFTAATNKFAYAQVFANSHERRPLGHRDAKPRLGRGLAVFRARHKTSRAA